jgi:hypothetical protein
MKILGLKSVIKCGSVHYVVEQITRKGVTLSGKTKTVFALSDILENLKLKTMVVEKV